MAESPGIGKEDRSRRDFLKKGSAAAVGASSAAGRRSAWSPSTASAVVVPGGSQAGVVAACGAVPVRVQLDPEAPPHPLRHTLPEGRISALEGVSRHRRILERPGHPLHQLVALGVDGARVEGVAAVPNAQEAGGLLEGLRTETRNVEQLLAAPEGPVFVAMLHDVPGDG